MSPFASLREYERFIYTLQQQFPRIVRSTLVLAQRAASLPNGPARLPSAAAIAWSYTSA